MPFVWVNEPQTPPQVDPLFYGSNTVSNQVGLVANTVEVHPPPMGVLSYNTLNVGYDVLYRYTPLNVSNLHTDHLTGGNITANLVTANSLTINTAAIGNASINSLNTVMLYMTGNSTANLHMVTKGYVDALIANSTPEGGNLQLLIQAAGDLILGVSDNTANRVAVGTDGQILVMSPTPNTKVRWSSVGGTGDKSSFKNIFVRTHTDYPLCNTRVQLHQADEIVMDDGKVTRNWDLTTADILVNGVNGLDTGTVTANTWYEVYAIRNPTTKSRGLLFHQALDRRPWVYITDSVPSTTPEVVRRAFLGDDTTLFVAQQFVAPITGKVTSAEMAIARSGDPTGNCWLTLQAQDGTGNADGVILSATNYRMTRELPRSTAPGRLRFVFRDPYTVTANGNYCLVYHSDYPIANGANAAHHTVIYGTATEAYTGGNARSFSANTNSWRPTISMIDVGFRVFIEANNTPVVMPTGYTQKCLISYVSTGHFGTFREYTQRNRKIITLHHWDWRFIDYVSGSGYVRFDQPYSIPVTRMFTLHLGIGVPPVPCLVQISYLCTGARSPFNIFGELNAPALTANTYEGAGADTLGTVETDGVIYANNPPGTGFYFTNPILAEEQAVSAVLATTLIQLMPATIEF